MANDEILEQHAVIFKGLKKICNETVSSDKLQACRLIYDKGVLGKISLKEALEEIVEIAEDPEIKKVLSEFQQVAPSQEIE